MIYIGLDDTDTAATRGTNQLARLIVQAVSDRFRCVWIARHQLLFDPRVPYTSKNGCASIVFEPRKDENSPGDVSSLLARIEAIMRAEFIAGSDPGLCLLERQTADRVNMNRAIFELTNFGRRCQRELVCQAEARELAAAHDIPLLGLGGTEDGVIGALAAVGLAMSGADGRVVQLGEAAEDLSGLQSIDALAARGVAVRTRAENAAVASGVVDVGKKLRPNLRGERFVLFVEPARSGPAGDAAWQAIRLP